ncbi:MAG: carboxymuconolactone decarboxylase family protein [Gemmatimonadales bacterium]|jgi:4-carboxymuconolactone decarboxylase|nr:carboxymuconolactone decarboxylase family protein [Gemmatimonadales bacterium]MBP6570060.1 carboxymuconolactone decarboxylase family protein [Gemmatimonadales bacterium]MBP7622169.1 carboxymuconolactone decarboxylase family protein [Gemmatimonadales bacterium]MBP9898406.1 carboxymuconolactone decarboxylase family protein [Gemmatimonadales bacterium]
MTPDTTSALDESTRSLVTLAAAIAQGEEPTVRDRVADTVARGVDPLWVDELLLQSVLMVGWPRTLVAATLWRQAIGTPATNDTADLDYAAYADWQARGEATCRMIYGDNYRKLRENVAKLHPALDQWMVTEGYGRTLSRPGLEPWRRELCVIAQTAVLDTPRQLHSHLRGALNAGATIAQVDAALTLVNPFLSYDDFKRVKDLWEGVRDNWSPLA